MINKKSYSNCKTFGKKTIVCYAFQYANKLFRISKNLLMPKNIYSRLSLAI